MKNFRLFSSSSLLLAAIACTPPADVAIDAGDPSGCYMIATGKTSWWRPRALLAAPKDTASAHFFLKRNGDSGRVSREWGVTLKNDSIHDAGSTSNWYQRADRALLIEVWDVDWGYTMTLIPVTRDSVRGYVHFGGDGLTGTARIVGHRSPCPA